MKLTELLVDQNLIVQLNWGEQKIEFTSYVIGKDDHAVFLTPYYHDGTELSININPAKGIVCSLFTDDPITKQRISWKNVELTTVTKNQETFYSVTTNIFNTDSRQDERRTHERITIQAKGQVFDGDSKNSTDIIIHDISDVGVSFYAPTSFSPQSNSMKVTFTDAVNDHSFNVKVDGVITRVEKKAGNTFVACKISNRNKDYQIYGFLKKLSEKK